MQTNLENNIISWTVPSLYLVLPHTSILVTSFMKWREYLIAFYRPEFLF
jgi:hypothetical protein